MHAHGQHLLFQFGLRGEVVACYRGWRSVHVYTLRTGLCHAAGCDSRWQAQLPSCQPQLPSTVTAHTHTFPWHTDWRPLIPPKSSKTIFGVQIAWDSGMETFYAVVFGVLAALTLGLVLTQNSDGSIVPSTGRNVASFIRLRNSYVFVYALMMGESE